MPGRAFFAINSTIVTGLATWSKSCRAWKNTVASPDVSAPRSAAADIIAITGSLPTAWRRQVETIFFEASGRSFEPGPEREAFLQRWLGRYLEYAGDRVLLALAGEAVSGYLVGSLDNPAKQQRFFDLDYYRTHFADACRRFPAHLHINLAPAFRSRGIGAALIESFAAHAAAAGAIGVHVVTGQGMRNVRFYERCGFAAIGSAPWNGREVLFLARPLAAAAKPKKG
jgi:GNAT superfamily N-acetyltransferase